MTGPTRSARSIASNSYAFADGGTVTNLARRSRQRSRWPLSGAGFRADVTRNLDFDLEIAVPLSEARFMTPTTKSPRIKSARESDRSDMTLARRRAGHYQPLPPRIGKVAGQVGVDDAAIHGQRFRPPT